MNISRVGLVGTLMLMWSVSSAGAADLYDDYRGSLKDDGYAVEAPQERWYLRGDIGIGVSADGTVSDTIIEQGLASPFINQDFDDGWSLGGGIGYYLMRGIRMDATLDYRMGMDAYGLLPPPATPPLAEFTGEVDTLVGLANFYYDFDMGHRITPYVGVGLGFAHHRISGDDADDSDTSFAWALMAGVDIDLRDRWKLDIGYRYLDMGDAQFDDKKNGTPAKDFVLDDLESHEIRVGLRYSFGCWRDCAVASYEPMK
ncbi:MAG: outer surface protein [Rhodomicrobium sp.]|nr:MAG: outer surface protein [Rhodomicrobium sp.]